MQNTICGCHHMDATRIWAKLCQSAANKNFPALEQILAPGDAGGNKCHNLSLQLKVGSPRTGRDGDTLQGAVHRRSLRQRLSGPRLPVGAAGVYAWVLRRVSLPFHKYYYLTGPHRFTTLLMMRWEKTADCDLGRGFSRSKSERCTSHTSLASLSCLWHRQAIVGNPISSSDSSNRNMFQLTRTFTSGSEIPTVALNGTCHPTASAACFEQIWLAKKKKWKAPIFSCFPLLFSR